MLRHSPEQCPPSWVRRLPAGRQTDDGMRLAVPLGTAPARAQFEPVSVAPAQPSLDFIHASSANFKCAKFNCDFVSLAWDSL